MTDDFRRETVKAFRGLGNFLVWLMGIFGVLLLIALGLVMLVALYGIVAEALS